MRRLAIPLALMIVASGCGTAAPDKSLASDGRLSLKLAPDGKTFAKGAPIVLTATVTNLSDNALRVPNGGVWHGGSFRFGLILDVIGPDNVHFAPIYPPMQFMPVRLDDFTLLAPGKSLRVELDISEFVQARPDWKSDSRPNRHHCDYVVRAKFANSEKGWLGRRSTDFHVPADMWLGETPWAEITISVR